MLESGDGRRGLPAPRLVLPPVPDIGEIIEHSRLHCGQHRSPMGCPAAPGDGRTVLLSGWASGCGAVLSEPKPKRSRRRVPLPADVVTALHRVRLHQKAERLRAGSVWAGHSDMVLTTELGTMVDPRNRLRVVEVAARWAGLERGRCPRPAAQLRDRTARGRRAHQSDSRPARSRVALDHRRSVRAHHPGSRAGRHRRALGRNGRI